MAVVVRSVTDITSKRVWRRQHLSGVGVGVVCDSWLMDTVCW